MKYTGTYYTQQLLDIELGLYGGLHSCSIFNLLHALMEESRSASTKKGKVKCFPNICKLSQDMTEGGWSVSTETKDRVVKEMEATLAGADALRASLSAFSVLTAEALRASSEDARQNWKNIGFLCIHLHGMCRSLDAQSIALLVEALVAHGKGKQTSHPAMNGLIPKLGLGTFDESRGVLNMENAGAILPYGIEALVALQPNLEYVFWPKGAVIAGNVHDDGIALAVNKQFVWSTDKKAQDLVRSKPTSCCFV